MPNLINTSPFMSDRFLSLVEVRTDTVTVAATEKWHARIDGSLLCHRLIVASLKARWLETGRNVQLQVNYASDSTFNIRDQPSDEVRTCRRGLAQAQGPR